MIKLLAKWLIASVGVLAAAYLIDDIVVQSTFTAIVVAFFLGLFNAIVRPILVVLTLPITILTLGLFIFVINALVFWFLSTFIKGFEIDGFVPAFLGALIVTAISWVGNWVLKDRE